MHQKEGTWNVGLNSANWAGEPTLILWLGAVLHCGIQNGCLTAAWTQLHMAMNAVHSLDSSPIHCGQRDC